MNYRFENISTQSKENLVEVYKRTLRKSCRIFGILVAIMLVVFLASSLFARSFSLIYTAIYVVVVLFVGNKVLRMPRNSAEKAYQKNQELYHCEPQNHIFFYDTEMKGRNLQSGVEIQVPYDKIEGVMETKNLFLLRIPDSRMVIVDKRGFQRGDSSEFGTFMREKCTSAKFG